MTNPVFAAKERADMEKLAEGEREVELAAVKQQFSMSKKPRMRVIYPTEKFRFSLDWGDKTEDKSRDVNSLCRNARDAPPLFGRRFRAGMEQRKLAAGNEEKLQSVNSYD